MLTKATAKYLHSWHTREYLDEQLKFYNNSIGYWLTQIKRHGKDNLRNFSLTAVINGRNYYKQLIKLYEHTSLNIHNDPPGSTSLLH